MEKNFKDKTNLISNNKENIYLSIIIPAYNEEKRIVKTTECIISYLNSREYKSEIILVDDGSTDRTTLFIERIDTGTVNLRILKNNKNMGKGFSIKKGVSESKGEFILFSDADLSTPIEEIENFLPYLHNGFDVVIGSRGLKESNIQIHQAWYRERMGKIFGSLVRFMVLPGIADSQCGFKCFTKSSAKRIFHKQKLNGFCFDVELLFISRKMNYKIKEVPICWRNSPASTVKPIRNSMRMFFDLLKIRYYEIKGAYGDV